jgi:hypothetical protein
MRKHHRFSPSADKRREYAKSRERLIRVARRTVGSRGSLSLLVMLCRRWGDSESLDAAKAFAEACGGRGQYRRNGASSGSSRLSPAGPPTSTKARDVSRS